MYNFLSEGKEGFLLTRQKDDIQLQLKSPKFMVVIRDSQVVDQEGGLFREAVFGSPLAWALTQQA